MLRAVGRAFVGEGTLTERQGAILVAGSGVIYSFTAIAYRAISEATDWQFLAWRGLTTALAMVVLVALRHRSRPVRFRGTGWRALLAGGVLAVTSMLYILALDRTTAATTLFLLATAPVFAAVFGWLLLRERVEPATIVAIAITAAGVVLIVGSGLDTGSTVGVALAGLIPITLGLYNALLRSSPGADPVVPTLVAGVVLFVIAAAVALPGPGLAVPWRDVALATCSGGIALGLGTPMMNLGHRSVAAARVPLLLMTEIVLAPLWVWIWPGETPSTGTLVGGGVVLGAVVWLLLRASDQGEATVAAAPGFPTMPTTTTSLEAEAP